LGYIQHHLTNGITDILVRIGPTDLTAGMVVILFAKIKQFLIPAPGTTSGGGTIPTVTDNLFSQGSISAHEIGISFEPTTSLQEQNGELTWGQ
jgi:hypothetical protein